MNNENTNKTPQPVDAAQAVPEDDLNWLLSDMDAKKWADEFCKRNPSNDHGLMLSWFACSIMTGFDEANRRHAALSPAAQPAAQEPTTLGQQIAAAQAVVASWSPATRAAVQLEGAAAQGPVPEWRSVLEELVVLIDDHLNGEYEIDSFTAQPARTLLAQPTDTTVDEKCTFCGAPWGRYGCTCPKPTDTTKGA